MSGVRYRTTNKYGVVGPDEWNRWSKQARAVFNQVYELAKDQSVFKHPMLTLVKPAFWHHTRLQIAYAAAQAVLSTEKLTTMRLTDDPPYRSVDTTPIKERLNGRFKRFDPTL